MEHFIYLSIMEITLYVNRTQHQVEVSEDETLLWVLRDKLGLTGTKYSCGKGLCGACTVLLEGTAIRSCVTPAVLVSGKEITTIEGLSENGDHPVQQAWKELDVPQCGYCQPGQIMNAVSLLNTNPLPTNKEISMAMHGNICRCGSYPKIKKAIKRASEIGGKNE